MTPDQISLLINGGIAGVFAVFAIRLYQLTLKAMSDQNNRFDEVIKNERNQRNEIMRHATQELERLSGMIDKVLERENNNE